MYIKSGDYAVALPWLNRAEQTQPGTRSELLLAITYQRLKQLDQANHYLELAKSRAPENTEVERALAGYYLETGSYAEAIASLEGIRNQKPDIKAELGYAYQLNGNPAESARLYTEAANAAPKDLGLQLSAAQADVAIGSIDSANSFLTRAAAMDADYYRLHAIRGEIVRLQDRDSDAVKEYQAVLAHMPATPAEGPLYGIQMHMNLLDLYQNLKQMSAAQEQLAIAQKQIAALDEQGADRAQFLRLRATIEMRGGNLDSAQKDVKELLTINGKDPNNLQLDGDLQMKAGNTESGHRGLWADSRGGSQEQVRAYLDRLCFARGRARPGCGEILPAIGRCLPQLLRPVSGAGRPVHRAARLRQSARLLRQSVCAGSAQCVDCGWRDERGHRSAHPGCGRCMVGPDYQRDA